MECLLVLIMLLMLGGGIYLPGRWILGPIDDAARARQAPLRYSIGDFLCLFVTIQIPLAAVHFFFQGRESGVFWGLSVITWIVAPIIWSPAREAFPGRE